MRITLSLQLIWQCVVTSFNTWLNCWRSWQTMVVWAAARLSPACKWWGKLVDDSGSVVFRWSQDVIKPASRVLSDGAVDAWIPVDILIVHKTGPMHPHNSPERRGSKWWKTTSYCCIISQRGQQHCKLVIWCIRRCRNAAIVISTGLSCHLQPAHIFWWSP